PDPAPPPSGPSSRPARAWGPDAARVRARLGGPLGYHRLEQRFAAYEGERLYGLGQHQHGRLGQKGLVVDLVQVDAPLGRVPLFLRDGAWLPVTEWTRGGAGPGRGRPLGRGAVGQPPLTVRLLVRKSRPPADDVIS
ncbi:hypothetical protein AB0D84_09280, partial [Streptomyces sp. NPDC048193]|uniref:hypothetical protein n=1 Tax=Streptomyces sp. NPDC048193 TaxID=3155630 RepID=UPI00341F9792